MTPIFGIALALIRSDSHLFGKGIKELQDRLRKGLDLPDARLLIGFIESRLYDSAGLVRLEFSGLLPNYGPEDGESVMKAIALIREELAGKQQMSITGINYNMIKDVVYVLWLTQIIPTRCLVIKS